MPVFTGNFIGIEQCPLLGGAISVKLALGLHHAAYISKPGEVGSGNIIHVNDIGFGNFGELRDFAAMIRAHFDNGEIMLRLQLEQCQRHPDIIVEITARGKTCRLSRQYLE